jgi:hypothetical protein
LAKEYEVDLQLETLEAIATAANTGSWKDGGIVYEGDGWAGLSVRGSDGGEVAFVASTAETTPMPVDYLNRAHILAFQPQTALALINRIKELEKRLNDLGG